MKFAQFRYTTLRLYMKYTCGNIQTCVLDSVNSVLSNDWQLPVCPDTFPSQAKFRFYSFIIEWSSISPISHCFISIPAKGVTEIGLNLFKGYLNWKKNIHSTCWFLFQNCALKYTKQASRQIMLLDEFIEMQRNILIIDWHFGTSISADVPDDLNDTLFANLKMNICQSKHEFFGRSWKRMEKPKN